MEDTLTPEDAVSVLDEVLKAENRSYVIGLKLKLPEHVVESIHTVQKYPRDQLLHILIEFSKRVEPRPTRRIIVDVLKSPSVNLPYLAKEIEDKYCVFTSTSAVPPETRDADTPTRHELPRQGSDDSGKKTIGSEERQSATSPISPQSSLFNEPLPTDMLSEKEVKERVGDFNIRFKKMVRDTQKALRESKADPREIVSVLLLADAEFQNRYEKSGLFDSLLVAADVLDLFIKLNKHWDHFNYYLLQQLIAEPGIDELVADNFKATSHDLKSRMKHYAGEMAHFRRHTAVEIYCKAVIQPKQEVPEGFKQLIEERDLKTLQDVEEFRREVAYQYKLFECLVFWKNIVLGSVIITLWIPIDAKLVSVLPEVFSGEDDNEGSPVDPLPRSGDTQKNETHQVDQLPPDSELPHLGHSQKARDKTQPITKKASLASSVVTSVSKYVIDPYALLLAVKNGDKTEVERLIAKGADPNVHPIMIDFTPLMEASRTGNTQIAQLLIEKGADPNLTNNEGWTALMAAANNGRYGVVDILLQRGANPDMQDQSGWSALMAAVHKGHEDIVFRLTEAGATPHIQHWKGTNALLLAIAKKGKENLVDALLDRNPDVNIQDGYGETALIFACKMKNLKFVKRLLSMGANPDIANHDGETPILIATGLGEKEIVEELLNGQANPNLGTEPPLLVASGMGCEKIVELLVSHGASLTQVDERGVTAYEVAEMSNFTQLAEKLNPQQFSSKTPKEILQLTKNSLSAVQRHISRGPLFLDTDSKTAAAGFSWLRRVLNVQ